MMPSKPRILKCPHCGGLRRVCSIMSGNTFGMTQWSDMKIDLPMLPRMSPVLQCPICKKYHNYDHSQIVGECRSWGNASYGHLSYRSLIEAFEQLAPTGKEENTHRMMMLWAYNDIYWDKSDEWKQKKAHKHQPDRTFFEQNARALIAMDSTNVLLKAELHRELGGFEECLRILCSVNRAQYSPRELKIIDYSINKAQNHESNIFAVVKRNSKAERYPKFDKHPEGCIYDPDNDLYEKSIFDFGGDIEDDM